MVMGKLIGLPDDVVAICRQLTDEFMHHTKPSDALEPATRSYEIFAVVFEQRRRRPQDDLLPRCCTPRSTASGSTTTNCSRSGGSSSWAATTRRPISSATGSSCSPATRTSVRR